MSLNYDKLPAKSMLVPEKLFSSNSLTKEQSATNHFFVCKPPTRLLGAAAASTIVVVSPSSAALLPANPPPSFLSQLLLLSLPCCTASEPLTMPRTSETASFPSRYDFEDMGFKIMRREHSRAGNKSRKHRFISWFGAEPVFLAIAWRKLQKSGWLEFAGRRPNPEHLLWAFMWLKSYHNEEVGAGIAGVDEKTYRDKVWFYVEGIARLDTAVVSHFVAVFLLLVSRSIC